MNLQQYSLVSSANESFGVEYSVARVHRSLVLGSITNETLLSGEGNIGRSSPVSLCEKD